jgi:hypothetical protein
VSLKRVCTSETPRRVGIITTLRNEDGSPPYMVRWLDTGHDALVYPGPDAHIEHARPTDAPR